MTCAEIYKKISPDKPTTGHIFPSQHCEHDSGTRILRVVYGRNARATLKN